MRRKPYGFDENVVYRLQFLTRYGWQTRGRGKPTLTMLKHWKEKVDHFNQAFRIGEQLPNGVFFHAFCASQPYVWLVASIQYLEEKTEVTHDISRV